MLIPVCPQKSIGLEFLISTNADKCKLFYETIFLKYGLIINNEVYPVYSESLSNIDINKDNAKNIVFNFVEKYFSNK